MSEHMDELYERRSAWRLCASSSLRFRRSNASTPATTRAEPWTTHREKIRLLMDECERKRPTGSNGKHGDLHTTECGCEDRQL